MAARLLTLASAFAFGCWAAPAMAQYPPVVHDFPEPFARPLPGGLKEICTISPLSGASARECPVLRFDGYTFWAYSYIDNRVAMAIVARDSANQVVKVWEKPGARYIWKIMVDETAQTVTFIGQSNATIVMTWQELEAATQPGSLSIAQISVNTLDCLFLNPCTSPSPADSIAAIAMPPGVTGSGTLTTRTLGGSGATPGAGKVAYQYRLDMTQAVSNEEAPCVTDLTIDLGPVTQMKYDGSNEDDAFVLTQGGPGSVGLLNAMKTGNKVTFTFNQPICAGATAGSGHASQFFGVTSALTPKVVSATVGWPGLLGISVDARAPNH